MAPRGGYRQPERLCGRCGRIDEIGYRAVDGQPDICVNCYRLPSAVCGSCGKQRPCNYVAEGQPICKNCSPRNTVECAHCGQVRPPQTRWPEGPVCERCYTAALARRGTCAGCGDERRLVSPPGPDATICCDCAGVPAVGSTCAVCGREDKLYERGHCVHCSLSRRAGEVMAGPDGNVPVELAGVYDAIVASPSPRKALNWLRSGAGFTDPGRHRRRDHALDPRRPGRTPQATRRRSPPSDARRARRSARTRRSSCPSRAMDRQQGRRPQRPRPRQDPAPLRDLAHPARPPPTRRPR